MAIAPKLRAQIIYYEVQYIFSTGGSRRGRRRSSSATIAVSRHTGGAFSLKIAHRFAVFVPIRPFFARRIV